MNNNSDEMNLRSKQDIICHVAKVKSATSTHYLADVIPFLRLVFTSDGVVVGVVIGSVKRYDLVKIKPTESEAEH